MYLWKGAKKFGQGLPLPPPSFGQNPKEQQFFLRRPPLRTCSCSMRILPWYLFFCLFKIIHKPRTMLRLGVYFNHALIIYDYYSSFRGFYLLVDIVNCSEISTNICLFVDSVLFIAQHRPKCVCLFVHSRLFSNLIQCCGLTSPPLTLFHQTTSNQFLHQTAQNESKSKSVLAQNKSKSILASNPSKWRKINYYIKPIKLNSCIKPLKINQDRFWHETAE